MFMLSLLWPEYPSYHCETLLSHNLRDSHATPASSTMSQLLDHISSLSNPNILHSGQGSTLVTVGNDEYTLLIDLFLPLTAGSKASQSPQFIPILFAVSILPFQTLPSPP